MTWQLLHHHSCSNGTRSRSYLIRASPALSAPMSLDHSPLYPAVPPSDVRQYAADRSWVSRQPLATCRGPGKINTHDPNPHVPGRICQSLTSLSTDVSRHTSSAPQLTPAASATASVMPRCQTLGGGTKAPISQPNGHLSPNPPTPLTHEGELSWTESVSVTRQHGVRELSHFNLRGGIAPPSFI